ncbi:MAG: UDP-N-acetylmuramoyl-L-alanine--D-glutamate ligase [Acidimicrobiales bacterium]|nr:UDP-N-acetylmuramoyl-L-alanine--D-glutamate ligase [Acidimicrobiales bacterium]
MSEEILVLGLGVSGCAASEALISRGYNVCVVDDYLSESIHEWADDLSLELLPIPESDKWDNLLQRFSQIVVSPGIPDRHPVFDSAFRVGSLIIDEGDLASKWDKRPRCAVTGTNGKTTVVTLVTEMLKHSGLNAFAAGNLETPVVAAIEDTTADCFVIEASSFRLAHTLSFEASPAVWLNFAPDHLDHHLNLDSYLNAKKRVWEGVKKKSDALANFSDPIVKQHSPEGATGFGVMGSCSYVEGFNLLIEDDVVVDIRDLPRNMPHDLENAQAALLLAKKFGADMESCIEILNGFTGLKHRVELVAQKNGISFINDSKSTTPHSTVSALRGLQDVVLIVGGKNKGLDLTILKEAKPVAVIAIGEAAEEMTEVFKDVCSIKIANTMNEAVELAYKKAPPMGTVLLSPACSSFDWYGSYSERGSDFIRAVSELEIF